MRPILLFVGLGALSACTLSEDASSERIGQAWCKQQRRCARADFDAQWDDLGACTDAMAALLDDVAAVYELLGCAYDPRGAYQVLAEVRGATCEEWGDGTAVEDIAVYTCDT